MKLDQHWKAWLATLRDKRAKRLKGNLQDYHDEWKRCCLGHACHALGAGRHRDSRDMSVGYGSTGDMVKSFLPDEVADKLGIAFNGEFRKGIRVGGINRLYNDLVDLNDNINLTPATMADIIEEQKLADNFRPRWEF